MTLYGICRVPWPSAMCPWTHCSNTVTCSMPHDFLRFFVTHLKMNFCTNVTYNFVECVHHHFDLVEWRTSSIICSETIILHDDERIYVWMGLTW